MASIVRVLAGLGLLTLGRKLFWLFVAAIGFEFGFFLAERVFQRRGAADDWIVFGIALVCGIIAALLAVFMRALAIYVGGFLAGGSFAADALTLLLGRTNRVDDLFALGAFIVGGIIGVILVAIIFDWALIVLSSLVGAGMLASVLAAAGYGFTIAGIALVGLFIAGVVIQAGLMAQEH